MFRPNGPILPLFDEFDPSWTLKTRFDLKNIESKLLTTFEVETYVCWIQFDQSTQFDLNSAIWPKFDLWWPFIIHDINRLEIVKKSDLFRYISKVGLWGDALEPFKVFVHFALERHHVIAPLSLPKSWNFRSRALRWCITHKADVVDNVTKM